MLLLAGAAGSRLFLGDAQPVARSQEEIEAEILRGLDAFAKDVRTATNIRWGCAYCLTLIHSSDGVATETTYAYDSDPESRTFRCLFQVAGGTPKEAGRRILIRDIVPEFSFKRYKLESHQEKDALATNDPETKQIQISLSVEQKAQGLKGIRASVSARYLLLNKRFVDSPPPWYPS